MSEERACSPERRLLDVAALEASSVVANCAMHRERGLASYRGELGLDPLALLAECPQGTVRWLDVCCGSGRALAEAAVRLDAAELIGLDLVDYFTAAPAPPRLRFVVGSVQSWEPPPGVRFDLVTCVHGLHYVGDKLAALARMSGWLRPGTGILTANLDAASIRRADGSPGGRAVTGALREAGFTYDGRRHRIHRTGGDPAVAFPFRYLGADDRAGPNYTGQPAVESWYT